MKDDFDGFQFGFGSKDAKYNREDPATWEMLDEDSEVWNVLGSILWEPISIGLEYNCLGLRCLGWDKVKSQDEALARFDAGDLTHFDTLYLNDFADGRKLSLMKATDRLQIEAKSRIEKYIDSKVMLALRQKSVDEGTIPQGLFSTMHAEVSAKIVSDLETIPARTLCDPYGFYHVIKNLSQFDEACQRDIIMSGLYGHLGSTDVFVSSQLSRGRVMVLPPPEFMGNIDAAWVVKPTFRVNGPALDVYLCLSIDVVPTISTFMVNMDLRQWMLNDLENGGAGQEAPAEE